MKYYYSKNSTNIGTARKLQTEAYVLDKNIQVRLKHVKVNNYCVSM